MLNWDASSGTTSNALGAVAQPTVGKRERHHGLTDRHGTDTHARIVATLGEDVRFIAAAIYGFARRQDRRRRFHRKATNDRLAGGDPTENAAGMVCQEARLAVGADADLVRVLLPGKLGSAHAGADLGPLDRIYR